MWFAFDFCFFVFVFFLYIVLSNMNIFLYRPIWPMDMTLAGTPTAGQNEPGSNGNGGIVHTPKISRMQHSIIPRTICHFVFF